MNSDDDHKYDDTPSDPTDFLRNSFVRLIHFHRGQAGEPGFVSEIVVPYEDWCSILNHAESSGHFPEIVPRRPKDRGN